MALSSSSHLIPSSTSQSWNHDVFLSFRGEDTRKNFVDHLFSALDQKRINTYKDDEKLDRGESIGPSLLKAIRESRIAVIVFSKNYTDSSWCMEELTHIIECMDKRGQIVMPIFYDIDPSDVRKQNGKYGESFAKHERENNHKVESWRNALVKAGNLSGWVLKDFANGHEAKCIKDIVATISSRVPLLIANDNKDLIGIETRLQDLKSKLDIGSGGVHMVGIWGIGGGGKTTLASAIYMEISHQFEARCLFENIREESRKHGLNSLQQTFLSLVLDTEVVVKSEIEGRSMIKRRLCHKSVLVVLDDVDDLKQLEALAGSDDWFGEGSRIIITTRDKQLLTWHTKTIYEVSLLTDDEAIKVLSKHAFHKDKPVEDYGMLLKDVVSYAGGLPFALKNLGFFLCGKGMDEWRSSLAKLKCIPDPQITVERLKISYDGLKSDEKELFLDIACFMRRWKIDEAITVLEACNLHPRIGVTVLVQKSLIKVLNGVVDMHDLIVEMAHYIVRKEHRNQPKKRSRVWKKEDIAEICAIGAPASLMETEVLSLPRHCIHPRLPHVVENMKKLRWINLKRYPTSFTSNFQPTKLRCLMLIESQQNQLWKGCKTLPNLKILDLHRSKYLITTPDFNGLPCLERLNLMCCEKLKEVHPSIGYHKRLLWVDMSMCSSLKTFPPIIWMKKLKTLELSSCCRLQKFPDIRTNMDSLVNLHLDGTPIEIIPPSVGQFCTNLVSFSLRDCNKLKRIESDLRLLKCLKDFSLSGCSQCQSQNSASFKNLINRIKLHQDNRIKLHQDSLVSLKFLHFPRFLRKLNLSHCRLGDGDIPYDICELSNLQVLDLSGNNFSRLHRNNFPQISCLKFLNLSYCQSLVELPELPSSLAILKAEHCDSLQRVGDLSNYRCLWKVVLWRRNKLVGGERVLHSMLQGNAVKDRFMSLLLPAGRPPRIYDAKTLITLQLPHNWCNDFTGFMLCADDLWRLTCIIVIKQEMPSMDSQPHHDHWEEFNKNQESYEYEQVGYIPFRSLSHTPWWSSTYTKISFHINGMANPKVGLVPRKSNGERAKDTIDCLEFWEEDDKGRKTFEIIDASKSSNISIVWSP